MHACVYVHLLYACARVCCPEFDQVNLKDSFGYVPLFWATAKARGEVVQVLLNAGADPDVQCHGLSVVARAAMDSTAGILRALLAAGGCVNTVKADGTTPLLALAK